MSETAASRPRPKPRPRPTTTQYSGPCDPSKSTAGTLGDIVINDSDDQFVVNRGRTKETWRKLDEINKINATPVSDLETYLNRTSTPLRKRAKKSATPQWRKNGGELRLLLTSSSSESDDDIEMIGVSAPRKSTDSITSNSCRRQKGRARSRSLTPPPDLPAAVITNARNIVKQTLDKQHAPLASTYDDDFDDSTDTIVLDPELERIAEAVNTQSPLIPKLPEDGSERVVIFVKWQKHPLNVAELEPTWSYRMPVDESFRPLFETVAEDARVLNSAVVLSYNNKRIFPSTRPDSLGLCGEVQLIACHQETYDYIHRQARTFHRTLSPTRSPAEDDNFFNLIVEEDVIPIISGDEAEVDNNVIIMSADVTHSSKTSLDRPHKSPQGESDAESQSDAKKLKLILRSGKVARDITLIVRPTTKCGSIVKAYIKKAGLAEQYPHVFVEAATEEPLASRGRGRGRGRGKGKTAAVSILPDPRICVDGDKMDNNAEIGEADLDDSDMVDVVGL